MATTSFIAPRRIAGFAITLMLFFLCLTGAAAGQGTPLVTATSAMGLSHPTGWGTIQQTAIDANGDWLLWTTPTVRCMNFLQAAERPLPLPAQTVWEADTRTPPLPSTQGIISTSGPTGTTAS